MAKATTTTSSAVAAVDQIINVTSAAGVSAGMLCLLDGEWGKVRQDYVSGTAVPILRGRDGSVTGAHPTGANITFGLASDFANPPAQAPEGVLYPFQPSFPVFSYTTSGVVTPLQGIHILNGTAALTMTIVSPTKDQDGQIMIAVSNGKAAHTITYTTTGFGNVGGTADALTFKSDQTQAVMWIAANGIWCLFGIVAGAATVAGVGLG